MSFLDGIEVELGNGVALGVVDGDWDDEGLVVIKIGDSDGTIVILNGLHVDLLYPAQDHLQ